MTFTSFSMKGSEASIFVLASDVRKSEHHEIIIMKSRSCVLRARVAVRLAMVSAERFLPFCAALSFARCSADIFLPICEALIFARAAAVCFLPKQFLLPIAAALILAFVSADAGGHLLRPALIFARVAAHGLPPPPPA